MKKVIISLFIVTILVLVNKNDTKVLIPDNAIRFRIIANSNSIEDQKEKIEIRNELEPIIADILTNTNCIKKKMTIIFFYPFIIFSIDRSLISFINLQLLFNLACSVSFKFNSTNSLTPLLLIIAGTPI